MEKQKEAASDRATRQKFGSAFGIAMSFIGVAVGLGNVWRFPYMAAAFGGGAFLIVYFLLLSVFGIPALMAELTLGRMTRRGPLGAFTQIAMRGGKFVGWLLFFTVFMATSYYSVVVGWVLKYFFISLNGKISHIQPAPFFDAVLGGFWGQFQTTAVVIFLAMVVLYWGIKRGVEKVSKWAIPLLFLIFLILMVRTLSTPGAAEGLKFYLWPDFSKIDFSVTAAALGQVFFSLSLGGTFLLTYASYLPDHSNIKLNAISTGLGDGLAAVFAGLVIVPAAFTFGLELDSGPSLTFIIVPSIFNNLSGGVVFAALFFALLFIAAFLSNVAAFEVLITTLVDELNWTRKKAILLLGAVELALATVSMNSLDFLLKNDLIWGSTMQPIGSALVLLGLTYMVGLRKTLLEANKGNSGTPLGRFWFYWSKYVIPVGIAVILALGLKDVFHTFF
ncbi:MAG: sodium-dependent transporter [bacterium]